MLRAYSLKKKKRGQTICEQCTKNYTNNAVPRYCICGFFLGGKFEPCVRSQTDDIIKVGALVSVRLYKHGINLRTFVDLNQNKVMPTKIKVIK